MVTFFYNGLKVNGGGLIKGHWHYNAGTDRCPERITFYAREYEGLPAEVHALTEIKNNSDYQSDYVEKDHFSFTPDHPRFADALRASIKELAKKIARIEKDGRNGIAYLDSYKHDVATMTSRITEVGE